MFHTEEFFCAVIAQDAEALRSFFHADAQVDWVCTNERFTVEEYIRANCEYPGNWNGCIEKTVWTDGGVILAARIWPEGETASFHAVSFIRLRGGKIEAMQEYWADDGPAPGWRRQMNIGRPIADKGGKHS